MSFDILIDLIYFLYGISFFSIGIALFSRRTKRSILEISKFIGLLGCFGLAHGIKDWIIFLTPILSTWLPKQLLGFLILFFTALSYIFLMHFSFRLIGIIKRLPSWIFYIPQTILLIWLLQVLIWYKTHNEIGVFYLLYNNIFIRFMIALPSFVIASVAFLVEGRRLKNTIFKKSVKFYYSSSVSFIIFAFISGLLIPGFHWSTIHRFLETGTLLTLFSIVHILKIIALVCLSFSILKALDIFEMESELFFRSQAIATERGRIAEELHDTIQQIFFAIGLKCDQIKSSGDSKEIDSIMELSQIGMDNTRSAIYELKKSQADHNIYSLPEVCEQLIKKYFDGKISTKVIVKGKVFELPVEISEVAYRIIKEALFNIHKHSDARKAEVIISYGKDRLGLIIQDDGKGKKVEDAKAGRNNGLGHQIIKRLAEEHNGTLEIESYPEGGTAVRADFLL